MGVEFISTRLLNISKYKYLCTIEQLTFPQKVKLVNVPCRPNKVDIVELTYIEACDNVGCHSAPKVEKQCNKPNKMLILMCQFLKGAIASRKCSIIAPAK